MTKKRQFHLPGFTSRTLARSHGGELSRGKRKTARPIDPKQALHVVLRASRARGPQSLLHPRHCGAIHAFTHLLAKRWGIRVYRYANVGNHIHLLIRVPSREIWKRFLRELAGKIAIMVTGARKGMPLHKNETQRGFWDELVFTRIVRFGKDFEGVGRYLIKNLFEGAGIQVKNRLSEGLRVLTVSKDGRVRGDPYFRT